MTDRGVSAADRAEPKVRPGPASGPGTLLAAGTISWRPARSGSRRGTEPAVEIAIVHRPVHQDWSLPKGTPKHEEPLPLCAIRETMEETGAEVVLGPALPDSSYRLPDGRTKHVAYWTARVLTVGSRTAPASEIDEVRWVSPSSAERLLTHDADRQLVAAFAEQHCPECYPVIVIRHVTARPRDAWPRADADRPLVSSGKRQAKTLAGLLGCWRPEYLLCSPWKRCVETLHPYQQQSGVKVRTRGGLSEDGVRRDPGKTHKHTEKVLNRGQASVLCTHRPVLSRVLDTVRLHTDPTVAARLPEQNPFLHPGEILILHTRLDHDGPHVVAVEQHTTPR